MGENQSINSFIHIGYGYLTLGTDIFARWLGRASSRWRKISDPLGEISISYMNTHDGFLMSYLESNLVCSLAYKKRLKIKKKMCFNNSHSSLQIFTWYLRREHNKNIDNTIRESDKSNDLTFGQQFRVFREPV